MKQIKETVHTKDSNCLVQIILIRKEIESQIVVPKRK